MNKVISKQENAVKERPKNYPSCPFYEWANRMPNANCRSRGEGRGDWISSSEDTRKFCQLEYTECSRYMKAMGIEDEEYKQVKKEYFKKLFGEEVSDEGIENPEYEVVATKRGMDGLEDLSFLLGID